MRRYIAIEEHCLTPSLQVAHERLAPAHRFTGPLLDLGEGRLAAMDANGVDVQVLSHHSPGAQLSDPAEAVALARAANDELAGAVSRHPDRFAAWATLPTSAPEAAAEELTRAVERLGFHGATVHGRTGGGWLDAPELDPVLAESARLGVPLYLHPTEPPEAVKEAYYRGLPVPNAGELEHMLATAGWGWHVETGTHLLRMILSGVFDRHPRLQVILGHWGELVPFYLDRIDRRLERLAGHLQRSPAEYVRTNVHVTPGGLESIQPLLTCLLALGAERILYSADWPFGADTAGRAFIDGAPISERDKDHIAHRNAEALLGL